MIELLGESDGGLEHSVSKLCYSALIGRVALRAEQVQILHQTQAAVFMADLWLRQAGVPEERLEQFKVGTDQVFPVLHK